MHALWDVMRDVCGDHVAVVDAFSPAAAGTAAAARGAAAAGAPVELTYAELAEGMDRLAAALQARPADAQSGGGPKKGRKRESEDSIRGC